MNGSSSELARNGVAELVTHSLGPAENNDAGPRWLGAQDADELAVLVVGAADDLDVLGNGFVGNQLVLDAPNEDVDSLVGHKLRGNLLHLPRPCGAVGTGEAERRQTISSYDPTGDYRSHRRL